MGTSKLRSFASLEKCEKLLSILWVMCVASSYVCNDFLAIQIPLVGSIFPFRVILPVTFIVFLLVSYLKKDNFIKKSSVIEKWCYVFAAVFILYGGVSVFRAADRLFTIKRLFNICLDMAFFIMALILMRDSDKRRLTANTCFVCIAVLCAFGFFEIFNGSLVNEMYNGINKAEIFGKMYQYPVTFYSNTNDYSMALIFSLAVFYADWFLSEDFSVKRNAMLCIESVLTFAVISIASSRLCILSFCLLFAALCLYALVKNRKQLKISACIALCMVVMLFITNYASNIRKINNAFDLSLPTVLFYSDDSDRPVNKLGDSTLLDELFAEGEDGSTLNTTRSGGIRVTLLLYALDCIKNSYGLGMGLGNTEYYSINLGILKNDEPLTAIHCFIARIAADYGIFIMIPLAAVALLLLKKIFVKKSEKLKFSGNVLERFSWAAMLLIFPVASTASADAQDCIAMWLFLAVIFEIIDGFSGDKTKKLKEIQK